MIKIYVAFYIISSINETMSNSWSTWPSFTTKTHIGIYKQSII